VKAELEKRKVGGFNAAVIEMFDDGRSPVVHLDDDVVFQIEFKKEGMIPHHQGAIEMARTAQQSAK